MSATESPTTTRHRTRCLGAGEPQGRPQGGARWTAVGTCSVCGKRLSLTRKGTIPAHAPAAEVSARDKVVALDPSFDAAIESAMSNAFDLGLREDADDEGEAFWAEVLGEVTA